MKKTLPLICLYLISLGVLQAQLVITQYYEGTSFNKWIEITNVGPDAVDTENPQLHVNLFSNANADAPDGLAPNASYALTGVLDPGASIILKNSSADTPAEAFISGTPISSGVINFNGDDLITLSTTTDESTWANRIDVVGNGDSWGQDKSFVRNTNEANLNFDLAEWDEYALADVNAAPESNTERLGVHIINAGGLIISQYYEGTSFNKWIEVSNLSNATIDFENPQLYLTLYSNASADAPDGLAPNASFVLTGTIQPGASVTIKHGSADTPTMEFITGTPFTSSGVINFNGDDLIALSLTNDETTWANRLDVVGSGDDGWGQDKSFVRNINVPTLDFDLAEWDEYTLEEVNTAADQTTERLGFHGNGPMEDNVPPAMVNLSPAHNSVDVGLSENLIIAFNETVQAGMGTITIRNNDDSEFETLDITDNQKVTFNGSQVLINPDQSFVLNSSYYVEVTAGAVVDAANNSYDGFSGNGTWFFTTIVQIPQELVYEFNDCGDWEGWTDYSVVGDEVWVCNQYGNNGTSGMQMSGFNGSPLDNEDWFISPALDLSGFNGFILLSFWSRTKYDGLKMKLKVSTNYDGISNPNTADWTEVEAGLPGLNTDVWTASPQIDISAFKQANVYIAFQYFSNPVDGAALWTLDDVKIENSVEAPEAFLVTSFNPIHDWDFGLVNFPNASVSKSFTYSAFNFIENLAINAPENFEISKNNVDFFNNLQYTIEELNSEQQVYVRLKPGNDTKQFYAGGVNFTGSGVNENHGYLTGKSFEKENSLDIVTWNIEWFGSVNNGPTDENLQLQNAIAVMQQIDADIYAVQEIANDGQFDALVNGLVGYEGLCSDTYSYYFQNGWMQKVCFIYKSETISLVNYESMFKNFFEGLLDNSESLPDYPTTDDKFWASGRLPFKLTVDATINGKTAQINLINIHAKANTGDQQESYNRRKYDAEYLKNYIDNNMVDQNVIILGDYNDDLDISVADINPLPPSPYGAYVNDNVNFNTPTIALSNAGLRTYITYENVIDHATFTDDFDAYFLPNSPRIIIPFDYVDGWYGSTTSDHLPVMVNFDLSDAVDDVIAPIVNEFEPVHNSIEVLPNQDLVITFNEGVKAGVGNLVIRNSDDTEFEAIDITDNAKVSIIGSEVTINPAQEFELSASYYVELASGAIIDNSDNVFEGFSGNGTWFFTVVDEIVQEDYVFEFNNCADWEGWTGYSSLGDEIWVCNQYGNNGTNGMQMSGYNDGVKNNEDWFISPSLDLSLFNDFVVLSFWSRTRFAGLEMNLMVSTDYDGVSDPATATWDELDGYFPAIDTDTWTESPEIDITAYKQNGVYIAFQYFSNIDDGAARWTLDDIVIKNAVDGPAPFIVTSLDPLEDWDFGLVNYPAASSSKSFTFDAYNFQNELTLTAPTHFEFSKNNIDFSENINYVVNDLDNQQQVYVRLKPLNDTKAFYAGGVNFTSANFDDDRGYFSGKSFEKSNSFDIVTWNIEWFGDGGNGPVDDNLQLQNAIAVMQQLDADIYAVQEIADDAQFANLVAGLPGYEGLCSDTYSYYFDGPTGQKVCFIYKAATVNIVDSESLFKEFFEGLLDNSESLPDYPVDDDKFWASGRLPFMITIDATINGKTEQIKLINVHGKANTDPQLDSYNRRKYDAEYLKDYLDANMPDENIILIGDFNDDLDVSVADINPSPASAYEAFVNDNQNYYLSTLVLSQAHLKSYVFKDNVIDHIIMSDEMSSKFLEYSPKVIIPFDMVNGVYDQTTSDHLPIMINLDLEQLNGPLPVELAEFNGRLMPNNTIELSWVTVSERNNDHFILERSNDGVNYYEMAKIDGHGTTNNVTHYSHVDFNPVPGSNYYRLSQFDINGSVTIFPIVNITYGAKVHTVLYPVPVSPPNRVHLKGSKLAQLDKIVLLDAVGKRVKEFDVHIDTIDLTSGVYFVELNYLDNTKEVLRMIVE